MTAIREDLLSISWKDKPEEKESPFSQDSCFLFLLVREAPLRPWPPWLAPSAHPSLVHLAAPLPGPRRQHHRGGPGACARSGLTRRQGAGHGFPSSAPALWRPSCPRLSPPPRLRPGYASLATGCLWQQKDAGPQAGFPARSYTCLP